MKKSTALLCAGLACAALAAHAAPVATHPRLWIDQTDVARLRTWATPSNPLWQQGLRQLGQGAAADMDAGNIPNGDNGGSTYSPVNTEAYAALFAFLGNVDPDPVARGLWAQRAHTLLFHVIDTVDACMRATPPVASGAFCDDAFAVSDRSRWQGAAFPLAVDWLYPTLTAAEKARVRRVFIWWSYLDMEAYPNPYNNPPEFALPVGTLGDPLLRLSTDLRHHRLRFSGNNYFAGHMRQLGMMALALDPADDVLDPLAPATYIKLDANGNQQQYPFNDANGRLRGFLAHALAGWLHMQDYLLRNDGRGGMPAEGMEYAPTSIGIPAQFLLALETAGYGDLDAVAQHGAKVAGLATSAFYRELLPGYLHTLSPVPVANPNRGMVYQPAWYGDGEFYYQADSMNILGPLALHAARVGDTRTADTIRWIQRNVPPGGSGALLSRARNEEDLLEALMYFMVFDPNSAASGAGAPDPRALYGGAFWSDGLGRLLARTGSDAQSRWFDFKLGWNSVDHQHGDGLMFEFYRRGEWLTKSALGYGLEGGATDYKNSLAVENTRWAGEDPESFIARLLRRGAQMPQNRQAADPAVLARSESAAYSYVTGDATSLYNAWYENGDQTPLAQRAADVAHVSRSILWLKPDHVVAYDRARTQSAGRFKRFWLNLPDRLPATPQVAGDVVTSTTPGGQRLYVSSVLPAAKTLSIVTTDAEINLTRGNLWSLGDEDPILQRRQYIDPSSGLPVPGVFENYATRLRIEANGAPTSARFLTVMQGADAAGPRDAPAHLQSVAFSGCATLAGGFEGAAFGPRVVLFRNDLATLSACLEYVVAASIADHYVSGMVPWAGFTITRTPEGANQRIRIVAGGTVQADAGGVLRFDPSALPAPSAHLVASTEALDFGLLPRGVPRAQSITLTNRGAALLALGALTRSGTAADDYALGGSCTVPGTTLATDASCTLEVTLDASADGFRDAALAIGSNAPESPLSIALSGTAQTFADGLFADGFE